MRRKIRSPANPFDQAGVSPAKAMRLAFARACEEAAHFEAVVAGFDEDETTLAEIASGLQASDLIVVTKSQKGSVGLAIWDADATAVLVEQLITGRVVAPAGAERAPTPTDAAVISGVLDAILSGFDVELDSVAGAPPVMGFRKSGVFDDGRAISMALTDIPYRRYRLALDLCNGEKKGVLQLIFPRAGGNRLVAGGGDTGGWQAKWQAALADTSVSVTAILGRVSIPLGQLKQFEIGTQVPVPKEAIANISLEGSDQRRVATGRLGQSNGLRAVMVSTNARLDVVPGAAQPFENTAPLAVVPTLAVADDVQISETPVVNSPEQEPDALEAMAPQMDGADGLAMNIE